MSSARDVLPGVTVHLRKQARGPIVGSEGVRERDVAEALSEVCFHAGLRRGGSSLALSELTAQLRPVYRSSPEAGRYCDGFTLEAEGPAGEPTSASFERRVLEPVARRASRRLIEEGVLEEGALFYFEIDAAPTSVGPVSIEGEIGSVSPVPRPIAPLRTGAITVAANAKQGLSDESYALAQEGGPQSAQRGAMDRAELRSIRDESRAAAVAGPETLDDHNHYPVFYTRRALEKAERISRKGAGSAPPVETGGLLLGRLCWCPDSRTLFALIEDVVEASHSEGTTYTLTFTGETWERIQAVLKARQRHPATRGQQLLGQCHGHNFLPYDQGETCDSCPAQATCRLSTAYLSESDRRWCRAVFPREPWQLSHVFGLTPRREPVSAFYGQRGGMLERRGYYVVDAG